MCVHRFQYAEAGSEGLLGSYDIFRCVVKAVRRLLLLLFNRRFLLVACGSVLDSGAEIECRLHTR